MDKRIEIIELPVSELKTEFGNPRKPLKKKAKEKLKESLDNLGDFGVIVIDEQQYHIRTPTCFHSYGES